MMRLTEQGSKASVYKQIFLVFLFCLIAVNTVFNRIAAAEKPEKDRFVVYYFHLTLRCPSCILLEELTRQAVDSGFETELKNGKLELTIINLDEPDQAHFADEFDLSQQSVVISREVNGKVKQWKNLDQVWNLLLDEPALIDYIQREIQSFNGAKQAGGQD